jgi:hypothetical protein
MYLCKYNRNTVYFPELLMVRQFRRAPKNDVEVNIFLKPLNNLLVETSLK